jgi:TRAP-type C4-dicarboxylate transport system permease small subunit
MARVAALLGTVSFSLARLALWAATAALIIMLAATLYQVVARYIFSSPPIWTEELARYAMIWAGLLGATCSFRAREDPVLFVSNRDRIGRSGLVMASVRASAVFIFVAPVLYFSFYSPTGQYGSGFLARTAGRSAEMLNVSMVWFSLAVPLALAMIAVHQLSDLATRISRIAARSEKDEA